MTTHVRVSPWQVQTMSELSDGEVSEELTMWDWVKRKAAFLLEVRLTRCSARAGRGAQTRSPVHRVTLAPGAQRRNRDASLIT